jgi:hypothetical protein
MIGKTSIGRSFRGCCAYNMQKVEQGKGEILMAQGVRDFDQRAMVADFVRQAQMNSELSRSVWHTAISFDPQDETRLQANPQLMQQVASDYINGMGLDQSQYVVIQHRDTDHSHFHIIANRVASNGQTVSDSHNYSRSEKLLRQIEQRHQLTPMQEQSHRQQLENVPRSDRSRIEMRDQVRASLSRSTTSQELREDLSQHGVRLIVNKGEQGQTRGLTFEQTRTKDNGDEETLAVFKGSKLHQSLGLKQIQAQLAQNLTLRQDQDKKKAQDQKVENAPQIEQKQLKRGIGRGM